MTTTTDTQFALPTTVGSIVTFSDWADEAQTEKFTFVATLIAGSIEDGVATNVLWGDSFFEGDGSGYAVERILAGDPKVLFLAEENASFTPLEDAELELNYGEVVTYLDPADPSEEPLRLLAIYTPGIVDQETGELGEAYWMNSYGGYDSWDDILKSEPQVLVKGLAD